MLKSWVLEVKAITLHQPCPSLASGPCLWDSTCPLFTYKAMLNQTTTSSASIIFTFKVGILVGMKSRILLVPSFLYIFNLGQDRKSKPLPNPKSSWCCRGIHLVSAPIPSPLGKWAHTGHPDLNADLKERRMRKEKKLMWTSHKFNYSAHTRERIVC